VPIEFYSLPGSSLAIKEDFMVAEMMNSLNYFTVLFGKYPYSKFGAVFHPRGFGQGFASLLLLPRSDRANKYTYSFIAHETAHQWWGNIVAWRSYRDQWLSEGFAEYSGILYTNLRDKPKAGRELIEEMRASLKDPPETETGIGKGRLADVGPIVLGHRLSTRETSGAYQALIYNKGGLVLRMLHFLFSDPSTGKGDAFFDMMKDFVKRHSGGWATSESFLQVANAHFVNTPLARKYQLKDLNWFFSQWVEQAQLPSYRMVYSLEDQADGSVLLKGIIHQESVPKDWFMPLPLMIQFDQNRSGLGSVYAYGPQTPFQIKLPMRPKKVELDPQLWILSEKTTSEQGK
jgi:aminopeptidase N